MEQILRISNNQNIAKPGSRIVLLFNVPMNTHIVACIELLQAHSWNSSTGKVSRIQSMEKFVFIGPARAFRNTLFLLESCWTGVRNKPGISNKSSFLASARSREIMAQPAREVFCDESEGLKITYR